jgi:hypothetical protein
MGAPFQTGPTFSNDQVTEAWGKCIEPWMKQFNELYSVAYKPYME